MTMTTKERIKRNELYEKGLKYCPHCKKIKPLSAFGKDHSSLDRLKCECRSCRTLLHNDYQRRNRERLRLYMREYMRKYMREYMRKHPQMEHSARDRYRKKCAENPEYLPNGKKREKPFRVLKQNGPRKRAKK